jgi:CelD/BcsL family acetyltransferase involved in cellulose biosynthesis
MRVAGKNASDLLRPLDPDLERQWDQLAVATGSSPFVRPGWLKAWAGAFRQTEALRLLTVERDGELTGVLPLLAARGVLRSPTNFESPLFAPIAADHEAAAELAERLLAVDSGAVHLSALRPDDAPTEVLLDAAGRSGAPVLRRTLRASPYVDVTGDPAGFWRGLSKNRRHGLRRLRNRMGDAGEVSFEVHDGRENLDALLDEGFRLEAREWKRAAGSAILSRPGSTELFTEAARWAAEAGILRLAFLRLAGRPIAFGYNVQQGSVLYFIKVGMSDEHLKLGPGVVFTSHLVEHAFAQPDVSCVDMLGEDEPYKVDFASGTRELIRLHTFPRSWWGGVQRAAIVTTARARAFVVSRLSDASRTRLSAVRNRLVG